MYAVNAWMTRVRFVAKFASTTPTPNAKMAPLPTAIKLLAMCRVAFWRTLNLLITGEKEICPLELNVPFAKNPVGAQNAFRAGNVNGVAQRMPRTSLAIETIIGFMPRRRDTLSPRSISEDFSSGGETKTGAGRDAMEESSSGGRERDRDRSREREDRDEEVIKVFDGNASLRHNVYKLISLSRYVTAEQLLAATLWAFHITADPAGFYLTDAYSDDDKELTNPHPVTALTRLDGKRPAVLLRFRHNIDTGWVRVHAGRLKVSESPKLVPVTTYTTVEHLIEESLPLFGLEYSNTLDISMCEVILDKGGVSERVANNDEIPWENLKQIGNESLHQMQMTRFYLQPKEDPHGPNVAVFVGNLPPNLSQRQYENILMDSLGKENKFVSIGPIYYEYGSMVITYKTSESAIQACESLRIATYENDKKFLVVLLPNIIPHLIPSGVVPLLVFVNVKSGGCQGLELVTNFRKLLNPYQVYDLDIGGPLPGLYVFRHVRDYRILVCGGDGTIGWVLQCLDNVGQDSECSSPPCAIVPLGTGNDLARVLRWGPGYTGGEDPMTLLRDVIDAEEIRLDRWTVVFHPEEKSDKDDKTGLSNSTGSTNEDNTQIFVMNNYFGIGIDADLCLDFHNAREENPNKFNSRLHNKGVYVKMGLRKMMGRKLCKDLYKEIRLEVDGKLVELPPVEGIIILNILSWGSGANPWGPEREESFSKPNHWDGMLEVVGVTGVLHLGQIQSGLRSAIRIAQGGHIKIKMHSEMPIQVDGEPWVQGSGEIVVLKSALKATMLKKSKGKHRCVQSEQLGISYDETTNQTHNSNSNTSESSILNSSSIIPDHHHNTTIAEVLTPPLASSTHAPQHNTPKTALRTLYHTTV
nr:EOG090X00MP [Lepidurus arcticus]